MNGILLAVILVGSIGAVAGIGLGVASIVFHVKVDEKEQAILEVLPGANCGSCSFAGCADYAKALATRKVKTTLCPVGGEKAVKKISKILGVEAPETHKKTAFVQCRGSFANTKKAMEYTGVQTCYAAKLLCNGDGACTYGCVGLGDCVSVCKFQAISVKDGVARVDCSKCTGCGLCVKACPKKIITLINAGDNVAVACHNPEKGAQTRKVCTAGCIGCTKCVKTCPNGAVSMTENRAVIDPDKCEGCGKCAAVCVAKCIVLS